MSDLKDQEQLRDQIAGILQLSRESWKKERAADAENDESDQPFPRSFLFKALNQHPLLSATAVASVWYLGPARFGAMALAGASLFLRHKNSILPIAQQVLSAVLFKPKSNNDNTENSQEGAEASKLPSENQKPNNSTLP